MPSRVRALPHADWTHAPSPALAGTAAGLLEQGDVLFFPGLQVAVRDEDREIFSPRILASSKNASFNPATGRIGGTALIGDDLERLRQFMTRFADAAATLLEGLLPRYRGQLTRARASFRPAEIAGRPTSWRKDDTRLHVDSFPSSPVQGQRILRLFTNVNPEGRVRRWRVGGAFDALAVRYGSALKVPSPVTTWLLQIARLTKTRRTPYDALMLQLHDLMKEDIRFQEECEQEAFDFPSGSTWIAFTDQVSHAAMAGQYQLEQTFLLPVGAMIEPARSPLRILEGVKGVPLV